jgi:hypothetical protein
MKIVIQGRLSYPALYVAVSTKGGKPRYGAAAYVEPGSESDKKIRETIRTVAVESWGEKKADAFLKKYENDTHKYCYCEIDEQDGVAEGTRAVRSYRQESAGAPAVVDRDKTPLAENSGKLYSGCVCDFVVDIYAQSGENQGIRSGLVCVRFRKDGDAFSTPRATADDLPDLEDEDMDDDDEELV